MGIPSADLPSSPFLRNVASLTRNERRGSKGEERETKKTLTMFFQSAARILNPHSQRNLPVVVYLLTRTTTSLLCQRDKIKVEFFPRREKNNLTKRSI